MTIRDQMQRARSLRAQGSASTWLSARWLSALWLVALWPGAALVAAGCGNVTIEDVDVAASNDGANLDTNAGGDGTTADSGGSTGDAGTGDAGTEDTGTGDTGTGDMGTGDTGTGDTATEDTTTGPKFTGEALLVFDQDSTLASGNPVSWRKTLLHVFGSAKPPVEFAYVWWARVAADDSLKRVALLPYEDVPYVPDFTAAMPIPTDVRSNRCSSTSAPS